MIFQIFSIIERVLHYRGVNEWGAGGGAIGPPFFDRIEGAGCGKAAPHYYLYYYLPPTFRKPLTPLHYVMLAKLERTLTRCNF